jgi:hypothetical protein
VFEPTSRSLRVSVSTVFKISVHEDRKHDSSDAGMITENAPGASSSLHFTGSSFDGIGSPQARGGQGDGGLQESQQLRQISLQALRSLRVEPFPSAHKALSSLLSPAEVFSMADAVEVFFDGLLTGTFDIVENITGFMSPAALGGDLSIGEGQSGPESFAFVANDQFEVFSLEAPAVQIV